MFKKLKEIALYISNTYNPDFIEVWENYQEGVIGLTDLIMELQTALKDMEEDKIINYEVCPEYYDFLEIN